MIRHRPDTPILRTGHPLARDLRFGWAAAPWDYYDHGTGQRGMPQGTTLPDWSGGPEVGCRFVAANASQIRFPRQPAYEPGINNTFVPCSVTVRFVPNSNPTGSNYHDVLRKEHAYELENNGPSVGNGWSFDLSDGTTAMPGVIIPTTKFPLGQVHTATITIGDGQHICRYVDGMLLDQTNYAGLAVGFSGSSGNDLFVGNYGTSTQAGSLSRYFDGWVMGVLIHARWLSAVEAEELHGDFYGLFAPPRQAVIRPRTAAVAARRTLSAAVRSRGRG